MREWTLTIAPDRLRDAMRSVWDLVRQQAEAGRSVEVAVREPRRSLSQNRCLWACLTDVSEQCQLMIDGEMQKAVQEDWKHVFSSALHRESRMAKGIDGGLVVLGQSTSRMRKAEFADLLTLIRAYGDEHGVRWSDPALKAFEQYREAAQ